MYVQYEVGACYGMTVVTLGADLQRRQSKKVRGMVSSTMDVLPWQPSWATVSSPTFTGLGTCHWMDPHFHLPI